jgi:hypothetical protein
MKLVPVYEVLKCPANQMPISKIEIVCQGKLELLPLKFL